MSTHWPTRSLLLTVLPSGSTSREAWAQEEAAGGAAPVAADCFAEQAMVASLTKSVSAHESTIEDLEGKLGKMSMATLAQAEKTESEKEALKGAHAEAKKKMEQMKLAQELHRFSGQQSALVEALGLRCKLLTSDLEKLQEEMKKEMEERMTLQERFQQLEESVFVVVDGAQRALESVPKE